MLAPHAVDIAVIISSLIASLCFTFANHSSTFFSSSSQVEDWSAEIQTKVYDRRKEGRSDRPIDQASEFAFCKIVIKRKRRAHLLLSILFDILVSGATV